MGFDLGLGPYADRALSRWEEGFVPMRLADGLREARNSAGRPLVMAEVFGVEGHFAQTPDGPVFQPTRTLP